MKLSALVVFGLIVMMLIAPVLALADGNNTVNDNSTVQDPLNPLQRVYVDWQYDNRVSSLNDTVQAASQLDNNTLNSFTIPVSDSHIYVSDPNAENLTINTTSKTLTISDDTPYKMLYSVAIPYNQIEHLVRNGQVTMKHFNDTGSVDASWVQNVTNVNGFAVFTDLPFTSVTIYPIASAGWSNMNFETYAGYTTGNAPSGWTKNADSSLTSGLDLSTDAASGTHSLKITGNASKEFAGDIYQEFMPNDAKVQYTNLSFDIKETGATQGELMFSCEDGTTTTYESIAYSDLTSGVWKHYEFTTTNIESWYYALSLYTKENANGVWQVDNIAFGNRSSVSATETSDASHYYQTFTINPPEVYSSSQVVTQFATVNLASISVTGVSATIDGAAKTTYQRGSNVYVDASGLSSAAHTVAVTVTTSQAPIAAYSYSPASGVAPLAVSFTDGSTFTNENLMTNPDIEAGLPLTTGGVNCTVGSSTAYARSGTHSISEVYTGGVSTYMIVGQGHIPLLPSTQYTFEYYVYCPTATYIIPGSCYMQDEMSGGGWNTIGTGLVSGSGNLQQLPAGTWTRVYGSGNTPSNENSVAHLIIMPAFYGNGTVDASKTIYIDDLKVYSSSWQWSFGDGTANSTVQNPSHTFASAGTYTVSLNASNVNGSSTTTHTVTATQSNSGAVNKGIRIDGGDFTTSPTVISAAAASQGGQSAIIDYVVAPAWASGIVYLPFPGTSSTYITHDSSDLFNSRLTQFDNDGRKVILEIQPQLADVNTVINSVLTQYSSHPCVIGVGVDTVFKQTGTPQVVTTAEYTSWINTIKGYNSNYKLFVITPNDYANLPWTDNTSLVMIYAGSGDTQASIMSIYGGLASHYNNSGIITGFSDCTPVTASQSDIMAAADNTKYIIYATYSSSPTADFYATTTIAAPSTSIQFDDSSTGSPTSWSWNFGDGGTSTSQNPTHTYTTAGLYTVSLTATNSYGSNTNTKTSYMVITTSNSSTGSISRGVWRNYADTNNASYWSRAAYVVSGNQGGIEDIVVGQAWDDPAVCHLGFTGTDTSTIAYADTDVIKPYLDKALADGRPVILDVQTMSADPATVIDIILTHYSAYTNIIGVAVDLEWVKIGNPEHCTNAQRDAWMTAVKRHLPNGKLFLTTFRDSSYLPSDTGDLVILFDGLGNTQTNLLSEYTTLTQNYASCGIYTGYPQNTPTRVAYDSAIMTAQPKTKYILHVEYDGGETPIPLDWGTAGGGNGGGSDNGNGAVGNYMVGSHTYGCTIQMSDTLENSLTAPQWQYIQDISDGRGYTAGFCGFCSGTGDMNMMIKYYTTLNSTNVLAKYIPALNAIDAGPHNGAGGDGNPSHTGLSGLVNDWALAYQQDPTNFENAQLYEYNQLYWLPGYTQWVGTGSKNNLTLAFIVDSAIREGADGSQSIINTATSSCGGNPASGVSENTFFNALLAARQTMLDDEGLGDTDRNVGFAQVSTAKNYALVTPYTFSAYGDSFTITGNLGISSGGGGGTAKPVAGFSANPVSGSTPLSVVFTDTSTNAPTSYTWSFGDGGTSTLAIPTHVYSAAGTYSVTHTATNSYGTGTITRNGYITVTTGNGTNVTKGTITWGGHTFIVRDDNTTSAPGTDYWSSQNVYVDTSNHLHMKIAQVGGKWCASEIYSTGTYNHGLFKWTVAYPNPSTLDTNAVFDMFTFSDANNELDIENAKFGNGANNPLWFATQPSDSAGNSMSYALSNSNQPVTYIIDWQASRVVYTARYADGTLAAQWSYIGSSIPQAASTIHTILWYLSTAPASGQPVEFVLYNYSVSQSKPTASFTTDINGGTVTCTDTSTWIPTIWSYDFGDGQASSSQNPVHTYASAGTYTIKLTATNFYGSSTSSKSVTVSGNSAVTVTAAFTANVTSGATPLGVQFTDQSTGSPTTWLWNFGDSSTSISQNPTHTYSKAGLYTVSLQASSPTKGSDTEIKTGYISAGSTSAFSGYPLSGHVPLTVQFTDASLGSPYAWNWNFGDGNTSTVQNPSHTYQSQGTFTVTETTSTTSGDNTTTKTGYISVISPTAVIADFNASVNSIQPNKQLQMTFNGSGAVQNYNWSFGDGTYSTEANPVHHYKDIGQYNVTLAVSGYGTQDSMTKTHFVNVSTVVFQNYSSLLPMLFPVDNLANMNYWDLPFNMLKVLGVFIPIPIWWLLFFAVLIFAIWNRSETIRIALVLVCLVGYAFASMLPSFFEQYYLLGLALGLACAALSFLFSEG